MSALMQETSYDLPLQDYLIDVGTIDPSKDYFKAELADMWRRDRRTINRWQRIAINYAPSFSLAFGYVYHTAECPSCGHTFKLTDIGNRKAKRGWATTCPHCRVSSVINPKTEVGTNSALKIPGQHAKVLRLIGSLISHFGTQRTIEILTTSPDGKKCRNFIRKLLKNS